jgi:formylglycine-generating enzyme
MNQKPLAAIAFLMALAFAAGERTALAVTMDMVPVGDAGNAADSNGRGRVAYAYQIGKYDVTVGQYCEFLNAVAKADPYTVYRNPMAVGGTFGLPTIGIARSGTSGNYTYAVAGSYSQAANCPMIMINWGDAARYCNWLQNGQPVGAEGVGTTETGTYTLNGDTFNLMTETRNLGARYFLPTENEWYKAAYYKGGSTNAGYWLFPTQSNTAPGNKVPNGANCAVNGTMTDPINYMTPVGAFSESPGPYGTYDMGGDTWQWNESAFPDAAVGPSRGVRGGSCGTVADCMASNYANVYYPPGRNYGDCGYGFRVASVAVPAVFKWIGTTTKTDWNVLTNWASTPIAPNGPGVKVEFGYSTAYGGTVNLTSAGVKVGAITLGSLKNTTIQSTGGYSLTLDNNGAASPITVAGSHTISVPVVMNNDVVISGAGTLTLSGGITGDDALTVSGGTLNASSITVGTLAIGGTKAMETVPEPCSLLLIGTGLFALSLMAWRRRK